MAFTRRSTSKYQLYVDDLAIPYVAKYTFLGIVIGRSLTWSAHVKRLKAKLITIVNIIKFISGVLGTRDSEMANIENLYL